MSTFLKIEPLEELIVMRYEKWMDGSPFAVPLKMEHLTAIARERKRTLLPNRKRDSRPLLQFPGLMQQQELLGLHQRVSRTIKHKPSRSRAVNCAPVIPYQQVSHILCTRNSLDSSWIEIGSGLDRNR